MRSLLISVGASIALLVGVLILSNAFNWSLTTAHYIGISIAATVLLNVVSRR